jgi:hypothetical protein
MFVWENNLHKNFTVVRYSITNDGLLKNNRFRFKSNVVRVVYEKTCASIWADFFIYIKNRKSSRIMYNGIKCMLQLSLQLLFEALSAPTGIWRVTLEMRTETDECLQSYSYKVTVISVQFCPTLLKVRWDFLDLLNVEGQADMVKLVTAIYELFVATATKMQRRTTSTEPGSVTFMWNCFLFQFSAYFCKTNIQVYYSPHPTWQT